MFARSLPRRLTGACVAAVVGLAACSSGSSSSTPANTATQEEFCGLLLAFRQSNDTLSNDIDSNDPAATRTALERLSSQTKSLAKRAPSDIADDVATVSGFVDELDGLFAKYDYDLSRLSADTTAIDEYATLNDEDVQDATAQLRAYGDQDCGDKTPPIVSTAETTAVDATSTTAVAATVAPGP